MKKIIVNLGERKYPIIIGESIKKAGIFLKKLNISGKIFVITNTVVKKLYFDTLEKSLKTSGFSVYSIAIPDGESYKNIETLKELYFNAVKSRIDRSCAVIAFGGGVVGDIAGFFSATYMRGIPYIQIPTTLLAMVDSSVGGKTGVDLKEGKNLIGAFYQPKAVIIDVSLLNTLPEKQIKNGLSEVVKYGIISDKKLFEHLEKKVSGKNKIDSNDWKNIIYNCCKIKAGVVEKDEFENKGLREILNFGHSFGHAIETLTNYDKYLHGEAISIGMNMASRLAVKKRIFSFENQQKVESLLKKIGLPVSLKEKLRPETMIFMMLRDKKTRNGKLRFV
ncbi:MAG: 3-dehydroquinate synthase, partial [Elusimicrobia bacterium]|nr:3-dehydroquinate synthase [Elusimicrobiota bacterium]